MPAIRYNFVMPLPHEALPMSDACGIVSVYCTDTAMPLVEPEHSVQSGVKGLGIGTFRPMSPPLGLGFAEWTSTPRVLTRNIWPAVFVACGEPRSLTAKSNSPLLYWSTQYVTTTLNCCPHPGFVGFMVMETIPSALNMEGKIRQDKIIRHKVPVLTALGTLLTSAFMFCRRLLK